MKHIKGINELLTGAEFKSEIKDEGIRELIEFFVGAIAESPIAFKMSKLREGFSIEGPFDLKLWVEQNMVEADRSRYVQQGYRMSIGKTKITGETAKELIRNVKKSMEFKHFIKGSTIEKMLASKLKKILSGEFSDDALMDFLYYSEHVAHRTGGNDSNPWATTGTTEYVYTIDLGPAIGAWGDEVKASVVRLREPIVRRLGYRGGGISSNTDKRYEIQGRTLVIEVRNVTYYN